MTQDAASPAGGRARGALLVLAAAAIFSTGGAALKACNFPTWQVAGGRAGIACATMLLFVPAARRGWTFRTLLVGIAYAITLVLFAFATRLTTAANAIFLQSTAPVWLLVFSPWLLRERISRGDVVFMAVVGAGMSLFFVGTQAPAATAPDPALGNWLALTSGLTFALCVAGLRRLARDDPSGGAATAATVAGNLVAFLICLPFVLPVAATGTPRDWGILVYLGVVQVALAYFCLVRGMRRVPAFEASLLLLLEPVLNPVWTWLVHGEEVSAWAIAGGGIILGATVVHTLSEAREGRAAAPRSEKT